MDTRLRAITIAAGVAALTGCSTSDTPSDAPDAIECDVMYRAGDGADPEQATLRVEHTIGEDGETDSITFGEGGDDEMTVGVSYHSSSPAHGLVQAWVLAGDEEVDRQIIEFEADYAGGPERPEDQGEGTIATYVCDAAT